MAPTAHTPTQLEFSKCPVLSLASLTKRAGREAEAGVPTGPGLGSLTAMVFIPLSCTGRHNPPRVTGTGW